MRRSSRAGWFEAKPEAKTSISGLPAFLGYSAAGLGLTAAYPAVYLTATAHREIALALGGSLIGYALPLAAAIRPGS